MAEPLTDAPARDLELREASAELDRRLRAGERRAAEAVLAAYPELANHPDAALQLIYEELVLRERLGEQPAYEEYYGRFPQWQNELRKSFEVHEALARGGVQTVVREHALPSATEAAPTACESLGRRYELLCELGRCGTQAGCGPGPSARTSPGPWWSGRIRPRGCGTWGPARPSPT